MDRARGPRTAQPGFDTGRLLARLDQAPHVVEILHDFAETARSKRITRRLVGIPGVTAPAFSH